MARGNRPPTEERLDDFEVMYVEAVDGLSGVPAAFQDLEERLDSLRGRRFFGTFHRERYRVVRHSEGRGGAGGPGPRNVDYPRRPVRAPQAGRLGGAGSPDR